jgi:FkbM family methyltransferase
MKGSTRALASKALRHENRSKVYMDIRDLRYLRFNSTLARRILGFVYTPDEPHRVLFGPLRGLRLHYDRSINFHAILGLWDTETFGVLNKVFIRSGLLPRDCAIADVGSNIGYYSLWFSQVALRSGRVYAFEPNPSVLYVLERNLSLNKAYNVEVVPSACGDHVGSIDFFVATHHHRSSLNADWAGEDSSKITAQMTTLDTFFAPESGRHPPAFIKVDIEGGGTFALPGCQRTFIDARPFVLIESHTPAEDRAISDVLCKFGYHAYRLSDRMWVQKPSAIYPDKEGVWGTLLLIPAEHHSRVHSYLDP